MKYLILQHKDGTCDVVSGYGDELEIERNVPVLYGRDEGHARYCNMKPVRDDKTGRHYKSIADWCRDTDMSMSTAFRLLRGERESVKGHKLDYMEDLI